MPFPGPPPEFITSQMVSFSAFPLSENGDVMQIRLFRSIKDLAKDGKFTILFLAASVGGLL